MVSCGVACAHYSSIHGGDSGFPGIGGASVELDYASHRRHMGPEALAMAVSFGRITDGLAVGYNFAVPPGPSGRGNLSIYRGKSLAEQHVGRRRAQHPSPPWYHRVGGAK